MIPSVQFQSCNDALTTIHKDILEKFDLPILSSNSDDDIQLTGAQEHFAADEILMQQVVFNDSEMAISQDCIELETSDEMIACGDTENFINYTIIGNGLIVIEGSQMDYDDETKDSTNDLRPIKGIDLLVTVKNSANESTNDDETHEPHSYMDTKSALQDANIVIKDEKHQSGSETRTALTEDYCDDDDDDDSSSEHELTNLGWLIDLKNLAQWPVDANSTKRKNSNGNSHSSLVNGIGNCIMNDIDDEESASAPVVSEKDLTEERFKKFTIQVKQSQKNYADREQVFKTDALEKPPFNYAQIIAMAMMDRGRMTLKDICKWIQEHFAYFRYNKNWNNSIRHNLSLHFCFTKIARDKTEKGKGGYWELSMNSSKSEKKRIRNRRKHRDDRILNSTRNRSVTRKSVQRSTAVKSKNTASVNETKHNQTNTTNDSCNVSSASDASSSICSANGLTDETKNMWSEIHEITNAQFMQTLHSTVQTEQLEQIEHEFIGDVITNDLVIINGTELEHADNDMIRCSFVKTNSQIDSYFVEQQETSQLPGANGNIPIESSIATAILNDSSNETFIKGGLDQHTNLLSGASITASAPPASNVIVEQMPYSLSHMDTVIDIDHEFGNLVNMSDPELTVDGFFDYTNW